jgi:hypothetical protein
MKVSNQSDYLATSIANFITLLAVLLIGLKLTGYITWPWIWVLAIIWIPTTLLVVIVLIVIAWGMRTLRALSKRSKNE